MVSRRGLLNFFAYACVGIAFGFFFSSEVRAQVTTLAEPGVLAGRVEIIANGVENLTNIDVFTVPPGKRLRITDVIISNSNGSANCCARLGDAGFSNARTALITVPADGYFQHTFAAGINYGSGAVVSVRNGSSSGPIDFYLRGFLTQ